MKNKLFYISSLVAVLLFAVTPSFAAGLFEPGLEWETLETNHFYVHHYHGTENAAVKVAREAERIHAELATKLDHTPRAKIHLIVCDTSDYSNGATQIFPYPQVTLFITSPTSDSTLDNYDMWLRTLLTHELTHVFMIDMTRGIPAALRWVFGYSVAMNSLVPDWLTEGVPVFEETARTTGGRGRSAYLDMVLRAAVIEGQFPSIDEASYSIMQWPSWKMQYLFGGAFCSYLAEKYGEDKLAQFLKQYSGQLIPFRINSAAKKIYGKDFVTLWSEWEKHLADKYKAQKAEIESAGIIAGKPITDRGYVIGKALWLNNFEWIIFSEYSPHTGPSVRSIAPDGLLERKLFNGGGIGTMSADPSGEKLVYAKAIPYGGKQGRRFYSYADLYIYDFETEKSVRLTEGERARDPAWSPDDKTVAYISRTNTGTALKMIEIEGKKVTELLAPQPGVTIDTPKFSSDGLNLVFSVYTEGSGRDIFTLKIGENKPARLTTDPARDLDPTWSNDGRHILFTSERTGVTNIFAIDLSTSELFQVTNVLGGAFEPAPSPDGKSIAYSGYSSRGYDLYILPFDTSTWRLVSGKSEVVVSSPVESAPEVPVTVGPYSPWKPLLPRYLLPIYWYDGVDFSFGLGTGGRDPLARHAWAAEGRWGSDSEFLSWGATYAYMRFRPTVGVTGSQYVVSYGDILLSLEEVDNDLYGVVTSEDDYYEQRTEAHVWVSETFGILNQPVNFMFSYKWQDRDNWTDLPELTFDSLLPEKGTFSGVELNVRLDTTVSYPYSISPEKGVQVRLGVEWVDEALGSDYNQRIFTGDLRVFLPNPFLQHHVFALRAAGGMMEGDQLFQGTFRVGGNVGESVISSPGSKFFMLRGYEIAQFVGDTAIVTSGEYRFPIFYPQSGFKKFPVFFQKVHAALFADYGVALDRKDEYPLSINGIPLVDANTGEQLVLLIEEDEDWNMGVGAELRISGFVGYGVMDSPSTLRIGYANDLDGDGLGSTLYIDLGTSF